MHALGMIIFGLRCPSNGHLEMLQQWDGGTGIDTASLLLK
jgi:hypothetical protein